MRIAAALVVLALSGCSAAPSPPKPKPTATPIAAASLAPLPTEMPTRITGQRLGPWGARINQWQVDADGTVKLTSRMEGTPPVMRTIAFTAPRGGFAELRAILAPAERQAITSNDCPPAATDQGFAHVDWFYGARKIGYQLDDGCPNAEAGPMAKAIKAGEAKLIGWGKAAPNPKLEDNPQ